MRIAMRKRRRSDDDGEASDRRAQLEQRAAAGRAQAERRGSDAYGAVLAAAKGDRTLTPHQTVAIERIVLAERSTVVNYGVGCGKTAIGAVAAAHAVMTGRTACIVAPGTLLPLWERELARYGVRVMMMTRRPARPLAEVAIYLVAEALLSRHAPVEFLPPIELLVIDEHTVRDSDTIKAESLLHVRPVRTVLLSASIFQNRLADMLRAALYMCGSRRICNLSLADPQTTVNRELAAAVRAGATRELFDVLAEHALFASTGSSTASRAFTVCAPASGTSRLREVLDTVRQLQNEARVLARRAQAAATRECDAIEYATDAQLLRSRAKALAPSTLFEQAYSDGMMLALDAALDRHVGERVLIFVHFVQGRERVRERLAAHGYSWLEITAETPVAERQLVVDAYERREADAIILPFMLGSLGINFTSAGIVIALAHMYNPEMLITQSFGRVCRLTTVLETTYYLLYEAGAMTQHVAQIALAKRRAHTALRTALRERNYDAWSAALVEMQNDMDAAGDDAPERLEAFVQQHMGATSGVVIEPLDL